jgi:hypothetical protein
MLILTSSPDVGAFHSLNFGIKENIRVCGINNIQKVESAIKIIENEEDNCVS